jgi:hypothetical protein
MNRTVVLACLVSLTATSVAWAVEPEVYPAQGQTTEQQERDQYECHQWASKETGVDPEALAEEKLEAQPSDGKQAGATSGAAVGALRGAAGGDAAAGAARGFGIGRMVSVIRAKRQLREQQSADAQETAKVQDQLDKYDRAYGACLGGRGYTVK